MKALILTILLSLPNVAINHQLEFSFDLNEYIKKKQIKKMESVLKTLKDYKSDIEKSEELNFENSIKYLSDAIYRRDFENVLRYSLELIGYTSTKHIITDIEILFSKYLLYKNHEKETTAKEK